MANPSGIGSATEKRPENLTHCSSCGLPFEEPVSEEWALRFFPSLDVASFDCVMCEERA